MKYRHTHQKYEKIDGKWKLIEEQDYGIVGDEEYNNVTSKETIRFYRKVFGSKETIQKFHNGVKVTSELYNNKYVHILKKLEVKK